MPLPIVAIETPELKGPLPGSVGLDISTAIIADFVSTAIIETVEAKPDPWRGSPFAPSRALKPVQKSKVACAILARWFNTFHVVATAKTVDGNTTLILLGDQLAMVKLSTRWEGDTYRFQQIKDWNYQLALLLGISPQQAHLWIVPREEIITRSIPQHGADSRMLTVRLEDPPAWLHQYGGTLDQVEPILKEAISQAA